MGVIGATDHLMMIALVSSKASVPQHHTYFTKLLTWGNTVVNYYQDETSRHFRPSFFRIPVCCSFVACS